MARVGRWLRVDVVCLALALAGCSRFEASRKRAENVPHIGLRRGNGWSILNLSPPYLTGSQFNLSLRRGLLSGTVSAGAAAGGPLRVRVEGQDLTGFGPSGPVAVRVYFDEMETVAEGTWNGGRLHMVFRAGKVRGTVAASSFFFSFRGNQRDAGNPLDRSGPNPARFLVDPVLGDLTCEYFLEDLTPSGALAGGSICGGMPEETMLEIPPAATRWLTTPELVAVLLVVLSAPPPTALERFGPQFDTRPGAP